MWPALAYPRNTRRRAAKQRQRRRCFAARRDWFDNHGMIDRVHLSKLLSAEDARFVATHPASQEFFARARRRLLVGVLMPRWVRYALLLSTTTVRSHVTNMPDVYKVTPLETFAREIIPAAAEL